MGHNIFYSYLIIMCLVALVFFFIDGDRIVGTINAWLFLSACWVVGWAVIFMFHFGVKNW